MELSHKYGKRLNSEVQLEINNSIRQFESDDESLDSDLEENDSIFSSIAQLTESSNVTHLSVFISYTLVHSQPEAILFYLITELYKKGSLKDMRRWVYEIYSSFIASQAPLKILSNHELFEAMANEIDGKLVQVEVYKPVNCVTSAFDFEMLRLLREIFNKIRLEILKIIDQQLDDFQTKRRAGLQLLYGETAPANLRSKISIQNKLIEKNLMPKLVKLLNEEASFDQNPARVVLISALFTVIQKTLHYRIGNYENIQQFVSHQKVTSKEIYVKGHRLVPKVCFSTTYCDYCLKMLWGIAPQGYECECGIKIHEVCVRMLKGVCYLQLEHHEREKNNLDDSDASRDSVRLFELVQKTLGNQRIENFKRNKVNRPKSDPGIYKNEASDGSSSDDNVSLWSSDVSIEVPKLSEMAKKRRDIIIELCETEKRHVKILKILQNIFMEPLKRIKSVPIELVHIVFPPALLIIKDWHVSFEAMLKKEWQEQHGVLLNINSCFSIFEDTYGEILKENAAIFCIGQQVALEELKVYRSKNIPLQRALLKAESYKGCKRLQLKDLLLSVFQRLTKYPMLFERLLKYCDESEYYDKVKKALESSRRILEYVNTAMKNHEELKIIQTKLDKSAFEKVPSNEFKNFNLSDHRLIHSGKLSLKKGMMKLYALLLDKFIILLHKSDERFVLKSSCGLELPIIKLQNTIARANAVDKKSMFLISQSENSTQMVELVASSPEECEIWFSKITEVIGKVQSDLEKKPLVNGNLLSRSNSRVHMPVPESSDLATIGQALLAETKYFRECIQSSKNVLRSNNPDDGIHQSVETLNRLVSQLTMKIAERDHEREIYLRENKSLREQQYK